MLNQIEQQNSILIPGIVAQFRSGKEITTKAQCLAYQIKVLIREAKQEYKFAETAKALAKKAKPDMTGQILEIAVWHYKRSADRFRNAAHELSTASRLNLSELSDRYIESKRVEFEDLGNAMYRRSTKLRAAAQRKARQVKIPSLIN